MGIVIKQSGWNLLITGLGFILGAINVLLLATTYLSDSYHGLWGYVLSTAFLVFPFMSFGVQNTIVKYFHTYSDKNDRDSFLTQMLLWPLILIVPIGVGVYLFSSQLSLFVSSKNDLAGDYIWAVFVIAICQAYFEIFYSWTKVHMKTIAGNFLKEVFYRIAAFLSLSLVALDMISESEFIYSLVIIYALRTLLMKLLAFKTYLPRFHLKNFVIKGDLIHYSVLMVIAGSVGTAMIDLDKTMINNYMIIDSISWYNVAVFIATVIAVPARGMAQIIHPLTAAHFNRGALTEVAQLYKRSSLNLILVSGFLLILILCNVNEFYELLKPSFKVGIPIVFLIALVKFFENILGSNNAILYNSDLYRLTLWLGFVLILIAVVLNSLLIPYMGLMGAAIATLIAYFIYGILKLLVVYVKLKIHPFQKKTLQSLILINAFVAAFYFWDFNFHPVLNIGFKSIIIGVMYVGCLRYFELSQEISGILKKYLK